ncbi:MAG: hypothetical protein J5I50_07635 [Chitinophagaceae bacterium]|nr:hypothetical protein [Chitinophagaceae bacterium]
MKRFLRNISILVLPFIIMIVVNEVMRPRIKEQPYSAHGITAINSAKYIPEKCSWVCHNDTQYCKEHHVKFLKPYFGTTDFLYFGAIGALAMTGNYGAANIIVFVILFPLVIWFFIIKSLNFRDEIRKLKKQQP